MKKSSFQRTILNVSLSFLLILISVFPGFSQNFTSGFVYRLTARHNGQVLDVLNAGRDNQADVFIHPWTGGAHQQWKFENLGDGSYRLIAMHSGKVLDVNFNTANQANVVQHDWHGGDNQRWIFEPVGDGYYKVIAKFSRKVLDVNLSDKPGNVVQHEWHGGDNQRWKLEIVDGMTVTVPVNTGSGAVDLTGSWQDDRGGRYQIRQEEGRIWWYVEKIPELSGVFRGTLSGSTISGDWVDLPGAQRREKGSLTLRVVSKDRLEKISSSGPFNASVLTRR